MSKLVKQGSYNLEVYDDEIDESLQREVTDFLMDSEYCVNFYDPSHSTWNPRTDTWSFSRTRPSQPRLPIAWDEESLKTRGPAIHKLWLAINKALFNLYDLSGVPEAMPNYMTGISPLSGLPKPDGSLGKPNCAWRIYGSGNERELRGRTKSIHRDSPVLEDDRNVNIVYFGNAEWYPQFYGETLFHSNDPSTGDFTGKFEQDQPRNYPIGEVENVVAPKAGRFMVFDARYLHQVKPAANYAPNIMGVVFRARIRD